MRPHGEKKIKASVSHEQCDQIGEISPLWPFLKSLFSSWQNFEPTLANKNYDFGQIIMYINALTLNN